MPARLTSKIPMWCPCTWPTISSVPVSGVGPPRTVEHDVPFADASTIGVLLASEPAI
ncbi:hypothetical protein BMS3Bbin01_01350 [bacterium BMS3Bbin01]|nr:hypothetical protein BMS3Bbin01_01350 [bacterium BMS3Bbin01]